MDGVFKVTRDHKCQPIPNVHQLRQTISDAVEGTKQISSSVTDLVKQSLQNNSLEPTPSFKLNMRRRIRYKRHKLGLTPAPRPKLVLQDDREFNIIPAGTLRGKVVINQYIMKFQLLFNMSLVCNQVSLGVSR